jgi:hypothetical protein
MKFLNFYLSIVLMSMGVRAFKLFGKRGSKKTKLTETKEKKGGDDPEFWPFTRKKGIKSEKSKLADTGKESDGDSGSKSEEKRESEFLGSGKGKGKRSKCLEATELKEKEKGSEFFGARKKKEAHLTAGEKELISNPAMDG